MRNKKHYCGDCGKLLGDDLHGWSCNQEDDGKETCEDCHLLRRNQENLNEEKVLRKKQQKEGFGDIPYKTYHYCSQNCSNFSTHVERIPIDALKEYSTACGEIPNHPFTSTVRNFIKANSGKDFIIAEVYDCSKDMIEEFKSAKVMINMAVHWNGNEKTRISFTNKFAELISDNGGALRPEENFEDGWDTYESE